MRKDYYSNSKDYINRWVISYADFTTLLLALFVVMYGLSQMNINHLEKPFISSEKVEKTVLNSNNKENISTKVKNTDTNVNFLNKKKSIENINKKIAANYTDKSDNMLSTDDIEKLLSQKLKNTKGVIFKKDAKGLTIRLNDAVLFNPGSAIIKSKALLTLDNLSEVLRNIPNSVRIEGHTDNTPIKTGKYPSNWELSTARATNIVVYLIKKQGIAPDRLSAAGYGEYKPINTNDTTDGRASNRRVDIMILKSDN